MEPVVRVILEDSIRRDIRPEVSVTGEFVSYYSLKAREWFSGIGKFQRAVKKPVKKLLETQDVYTLFKPARKSTKNKKSLPPI